MTYDVQRISGTSAKAAARLCNFVTTKADLLPAHRAYLDGEIASTIRSMSGPWVDIFGYASRKGNAALNLDLSKRRLEAVRSHIARTCGAVNFQIQQGLGEEQSGPDALNNDGYWRAVDIYVYAHRPPPRPKPIPVVQGSTQFEIRVVGGGSASIVVQADNYFFQIVDLTRRRTAFYLYTGGGVGISIPKIPGPGSVTKTGPPTKFRTSRVAELHQFNSKAQLYQDAGATFGSESVGGTMRLSMDEVKDHSGLIFTSPRTIPISGGWGIQMPGLGSVSKGVLAMVSDEFPFSGY